MISVGDEMSLREVDATFRGTSWLSLIDGVKCVKCLIRVDLKDRA